MNDVVQSIIHFAVTFLLADFPDGGGDGHGLLGT